MAFAARSDLIELAVKVDDKVRWFEDQIAQMSTVIGTMRSEQSENLKRMEAESQKVQDATALSIAELNNSGHTLFLETKKKFEEMSEALHVTFADLQKKVSDMDYKVKNVGTHHGGEGNNTKAYIPLTHTIPKKTDIDIRTWRHWRGGGGRLKFSLK